VLVFAGTAAIVIDQMTGAVTHPGVALTSGWSCWPWCTPWDISGAHLNPAVTLGFVAAGRFRATRRGRYIVAQFAGAGRGECARVRSLPDNLTSARRFPRGASQSFVLGIVLTWF